MTKYSDCDLDFINLDKMTEGEYKKLALHQILSRLNDGWEIQTSVIHKQNGGRNTEGLLILWVMPDNSTTVEFNNVGNARIVPSDLTRLLRNGGT